MKNLIMHAFVIAISCQHVTAVAAPAASAPPLQLFSMPKIDGFKALKFGISTREAANLGMECSKNSEGVHQCGSYIFHNSGYIFQAVSILGVPLKSIYVSFNKKEELSYISLGVKMLDCENLQNSMTTTFGKPNDVKEQIPDFNKNKLVGTKNIIWENDHSEVSHEYFNNGRGSQDCHAVFKSKLFRDPVETPVKSNDF